MTVGAQTVDTTTSSPPKAPAFIMGLGLGGFIDGIVLHQILQWHHMLTDTGDHPMDTVAGLETNTLADGFFHLATWVFVATAMLLTVRAWQRRELAPPWRGHFGMLLAGWGVFNLVEGVIDRQLLGIHHVRDDLGAPLDWDLAFLASGVVLIAVGMALARSGERNEQHMDEVTANKQIPVLIPPDKGSRGSPRRGWTGGRYSWMRNVLATEHGRRLYRKRKQTVEPLFGDTKHNGGVYRFHRRGRVKVRTEWRLLMLTHNLTKLHRHRLAAVGAEPGRVSRRLRFEDSVLGRGEPPRLWHVRRNIPMSWSSEVCGSRWRASARLRISRTT